MAIVSAAAGSVQISSEHPASPHSDASVAQDAVYNIVFSGQIQPDKTLDEVKANFKAVYHNKYNPSQISETFFSGKRVIVKRNIEYGKALALKHHLISRTGGEFTLEQTSVHE